MTPPNKLLRILRRLNDWGHPLEVSGQVGAGVPRSELRSFHFSPARQQATPTHCIRVFVGCGIDSVA
jgi:hypothetical protein